MSRLIKNSCYLRGSTLSISSSPSKGSKVNKEIPDNSTQPYKDMRELDSDLMMETENARKIYFEEAKKNVDIEIEKYRKEQEAILELERKNIIANEEKLVHELIEKINPIIQNLISFQDVRKNIIESSVIHLACAVLYKITNIENIHLDIVEKTTTNLLDSLNLSEVITIRLPLMDQVALQKVFSEKLASNIEVRFDSNLGHGECFVDTDDSSTDASIKTILRTLTKAMLEEFKSENSRA